MGKALTPDLVRARSKTDNLYMVKNLNLWGNDIEDVQLLRQMPNVEILSLSVNKITSLREFANCPKLQELYLRKNCINDIAEIRYLMNLPFLKVLWLDDNPCTEVPNYREIVIKALPNLVKLDNNPITPEEKMLSKKLTINFDEEEDEEEEQQMNNNNNYHPSPKQQQQSQYQFEYNNNNNNNNRGSYSNQQTNLGYYNNNTPTSSYNRIDTKQDDIQRQDINQNSRQNWKEKIPKRETNSKNMIYETPTRYSHNNNNNSISELNTNNNNHSSNPYPKQQSMGIEQYPSPYKPSDGVISATLLLIRELDERNLLLIKHEIDKRLLSSYMGQLCYTRLYHAMLYQCQTPQ